MALVILLVGTSGLTTGTAMAAESSTQAETSGPATAASKTSKSDDTAETADQVGSQSATQPISLGTVSVSGSDVQTPSESYQAISTSTATRSDTPIIDIPQSVQVVTHEVLKDQAASSIDDALQNVSGVTQANNLGGTQDAVIRRGFGENRDGSIMTNGMRTALSHSFNVMTDSVEVLKGPASTLYGVLDPGGMVNVVTKKPQYTLAGSVYGTASSFGGGKAGFDVTGPIEGTGFAVRLVGEDERSDYWRNFGKIKRKQFSPSISWTGDTTDVTVSYFHEDYSLPFDRGTIFDTTTGSVVPVDRSIRFDEPYNISKGHSDMVQFALNHDLNDRWSLGVDYSYSRNRYADNQARVMAYDAATGTLTRRADATQDSTVVTHSARVDLTGKAEIAGMRNDLLFGASFDNSDTLRTDMMRCSNTSGFNIYNPVYGDLSECSSVSAKNSDQTEKLSTGSVFSQDSLHLNDQWILVGGLRAQYYDMMAGKGRPFVVNTERYGHALVPNGGVVYKVTPDLSLYANVAKTFRPQSSIGSYVGDIAPETGISYETGAKFNLFGRLSTTVALYHADKNNVAYTDTVGGESVTKAAGEVRSRGVEVDITGALTDNLDLIASYALTDAKVVKDDTYTGKRLPNVARHTGSLYLSYDLGSGYPMAKDVKFGGGVRAASRRPGDSANDYFLPAYAVADLFASYTLDLPHPVTLQLNVKNLFDTTYYTSSKGSDGLANAIGDPFNVLFTVRAEF